MQQLALAFIQVLPIAPATHVPQCNITVEQTSTMNSVDYKKHLQCMAAAEVTREH
jgi:hypothetical protein